MVNPDFFLPAREISVDIQKFKITHERWHDHVEQEPWIIFPLWSCGSPFLFINQNTSLSSIMQSDQSQASQARTVFQSVQSYQPCSWQACTATKKGNSFFSISEYPQPQGKLRSVKPNVRSIQNQADRNEMQIYPKLLYQNHCHCISSTKYPYTHIHLFQNYVNRHK